MPMTAESLVEFVLGLLRCLFDVDCFDMMVPIIDVQVHISSNRHNGLDAFDKTNSKHCSTYFEFIQAHLPLSS